MDYLFYLKVVYALAINIIKDKTPDEIQDNQEDYIKEIEEEISKLKSDEEIIKLFIFF